MLMLKKNQHLAYNSLSVGFFPPSVFKTSIQSSKMANFSIMPDVL